MKRANEETETDTNQNSAKKGFFENVLDLLGSFFQFSEEPKKLVQIGRAFFLEEQVPQVKCSIQHAEIFYLEINEESILAQNNSPKLKAILAELKKQDLKEDWHVMYQRKEELLNEFNSIIIRREIQSSKEQNGKMLSCVQSFLTRLPEGIFAEEPEYWQQLEYLSLRQNNLKTLPTQIRQLTALKTLDLLGNEIGVLPETLQELSTLENVYLPVDVTQYYETQRTFLPSKAFERTAQGGGICFKAHQEPFERPIAVPRKT